MREQRVRPPVLAGPPGATPAHQARALEGLVQDLGVELRLACPQSLVQQGLAGQQLLLGGLRLFPLTPQIQGRGQSAV